MKKLSFLELEKEMETLSEEEAFRTKAGGGDPLPSMQSDCYFESIYGALYTWGYGGDTSVASIISSYDNEYKDENHPHPSGNGVPLYNSLEFLKDFTSPHLQGISITNINLEDLPSNYNAAGDQYIINYMEGPGSGHSVVYRYTRPDTGKLRCWDYQADHYIDVDPSQVLTISDMHLPQTTVPWTGGPTTTMPTTTGI